MDIGLLYVVVHKSVTLSFKSFKLIYKQLIISFLISLLLFYLILKKYPQFKLFFSLHLVNAKNYDYSTFSCGVDYSTKNHICTLCIIHHGQNYTVFDIHRTEDILSQYKRVFGTEFLLHRPYRLLLGKSKYYRKIYREIAHLFYAIIVFITTWVVILILFTKPADIYFLFPHFKTFYNNLIGYTLAATFAIEILSLVYLLKRGLLIYITNIIVIFLMIPVILKLPGAPLIYNNIFGVYVYIGILIAISTILYALINTKNMIKISFISAIITYAILYAYIIGNLLIFFNY